MDSHPPLVDIPVRHPREYYLDRTGKYATALQVLGIKLDQESRQQLASTLQLAQAIDDYIDIPDKGKRLIHTVGAIDFLSDEQKIANQFPNIGPTTIGVEAYAFIRQQGLRVVKLNEPIKQADTLERHLKLRQLECRYYSGILSAVLSPAVRAHPRYRTAARFLSAAAEFGNIRDTMIDLKEDYANEEHIFAPTFRNRLKIATYMGLTLIRARHNSNRAQLLPVNSSSSPCP